MENHRIGMHGHTILMALLLALGMISLLAGAEAADRGRVGPLTARLDVLSTPSLDGGGCVIWIASPNVQPDHANLAFQVTDPQGAKTTAEIRQLALLPGQLAEEECPILTPHPGLYRIVARLTLTINNRAQVHEYRLALEVGAAGTKRDDRPWNKIANRRMAAKQSGMTKAAAEKASRPSVSALWLEGASEGTNNPYAFKRQIILKNYCDGGPKFFKASESKEFTGATWRPYTQAFDFLLSPGNGAKTVYFKVKNSRGRESSIKSLNLRLLTATELKPSKTMIKARISHPGGVDLFVASVGNKSHMSFLVNLKSETLKESIISVYSVWNGGQVPTMQMLATGENNSIGKSTRVSGMPFSPAGIPAYFLIEIKAKSPMMTGSYSLRLGGKELSSIWTSSWWGYLTSYDQGEDNFGASGFTDQRNIRVVCQMDGKQYTEYKISESPSFAGVSWKKIYQKKVYPGDMSDYYYDIDYTLTSSAGMKTVYAIMRDKDGFASNIASGDIYLKGTIPLELNGPTYYGYVYNFDEFGIDYWYSFKVTNPGTYKVDFINDVRDDKVEYDVFGPDSKMIRIDATSRSDNTLTYSNLKAGTYYIRMGTVIEHIYYPEGDGEVVVYNGQYFLRVYQ